MVFSIIMLRYDLCLTSFYPMTSGISSGWSSTWPDSVDQVCLLMCLVNHWLYLNNISAQGGEGAGKVCVFSRMRGLRGGGQPSWANSDFISHPLDGIPHLFIHPQTFYTSLNPSWVKGSAAPVMWNMCELWVLRNLNLGCNDEICLLNNL